MYLVNNPVSLGGEASADSGGTCPDAIMPFYRRGKHPLEIPRVQHYAGGVHILNGKEGISLTFVVIQYPVLDTSVTHINSRSAVKNLGQEEPYTWKSLENCGPKLGS